MVNFAYFYLVLAFILNSSANLLLKISSGRGIYLESFNFPRIITNNYLFILGLFLFGLNALFYFLALKTIPISVAYPIMVVASLLLIDSFAYVYLKETLNLWQLVGYFLIIGGLILVFVFRSS